jgi:hypothetical protein
VEDRWQGLMYVREGVISLGGVARDREGLPWTAVKLDMQAGQVPLGDFPQLEDAKRAVEQACRSK